MKRIILLVSMAVFALTANAQIINVKPSAQKASAFERVDIAVDLKAEWNNPFLQEQVALDMEITSPDGSVSTLPCFYVSGNSGETSVWNARFAPMMKGLYTYKFVLREKGQVKGESQVSSLKVKNGKSQGFLHAADNWTLRYDNGDLFRGIGENICWESRTRDDNKFFKELHENHAKYNYDYLLPLFASYGGNFCRMWMCSWNFPIDRQSDFNNGRYQDTDAYMNESACKRLDDVVALAERLGIKIMLCMGPGNVTPDRNFFITETSMARHRNYLRYLVSRWGYSTSIAMWEFFNEIDNVQFKDNAHPIPAEEIVAWHSSMATYLKSIDPYNHIRTTSISHRDLKGLNSIKDIDINQKHIYKATDAIPGTIDKYEKDFGKPYIIGEFGFEWDWFKNFNDFADDMDTDFRRGLWYGVFSSTPVTPMSWWWEYFEDRNMMPYFQCVRKVSDMMLSLSGGKFTPVEVEVENGRGFGLVCGKRTFVYVFNNSKSTLESFTVKTGKTGTAKVKEYDFKSASFGSAVKKQMNGSLKVDGLGVAPKGEYLIMF